MIAIALLTLAGLMAGVGLYVTTRPRISFECYEKIEEGMTRLQVEAILGGPPRWEVAAQRPGDVLKYFFSQRKLGESWWGTAGVITVSYRDDVVNWKQFEELPFEPRPATLREIAFPWKKKRGLSFIDLTR